MFERFTNDARRVVVRSQEIARELGHSWIGTEHLLIALLEDPEGIASVTLSAIGVRSEAVRTEIELAVPATEGEVESHIPFTPRAKKVLELSLREAMRLKQHTIQPGHILLGLIREGDGMAAQAMVKQGTNLGRLRNEVLRRLAPYPEAGMRIVPPNVPEMTRGGVAAFDRARQLAEGKPVGSQHVLLGLFGDEDTLAKRALAALGVTREAVERELAALDPADTADESPERAGARRTRLQVSGDTVTFRIEDQALARLLGTSLGGWGRRGVGGDIVVSGTEPEAAEPFGRLFRAAEAVSRDLVQRIGPARMQPPSRGEGKPPGWSTRASVAGYSVTSEPDGPRSRLWAREGIDESEVRAWLAAWLDRVGTELHAREDVTFCTVLVGLRRDVMPDAPDADEWTVTNFSFGPGPAPAEWPRRPLSELLAFAATDLSQGAEPPDPQTPEPPAEP